jgi:hypothetical protein
MGIRPIASVACVFVLLGQAPQPVIRTSTRLVQVNVIVRDKNGPVSDLAQDDFKVFDKGTSDA